MIKVGDDFKFAPLFPTLRTVGSSSGVECTVFSGPFALGAAREFAVVVSAEHISTVGPRASVVAEICGGTTTYASPTAYTTLGKFQVMASGATQTKVSYARVCIGGTGTKVGIAGATLVIDGATFNATFGGADSSVVIETTACSVVAQKLSSCINRMCTNLDATYYSAGVTTGPAYVDVRPKDGNYTFDITSSAIQPAASVDAWGILCSRSAMYEFKAAEIVAKSTAPVYTHFVVRVQSTSTVSKIGGFVISGAERYNPRINIARNQMNTVSTAYST